MDYQKLLAIHLKQLLIQLTQISSLNALFKVDIPFLQAEAAKAGIQLDDIEVNLEDIIFMSYLPERKQ